MALIILAEDDEQTRMLLKIMLEDHGDDCLDFSNGDDALDALRTHPDAALLITDISMPSSDGRDVIKILRKGPPRFRTLPVILISGLIPEKIMDEQIIDAHSRFLKKPFLMKALYDAMEDLLSENGCPPQTGKADE